jgi:hypothetical protein
MEQKQREVLMKEFRSGSSRVLITTDLLARGIDVQQVSLVINYDLPTNRENYIHRIGRGGRFGRKGVAINFVTTEDVRMLRDIERTFFFFWLCLGVDLITPVTHRILQHPDRRDASQCCVSCLICYQATSWLPFTLSSATSSRNPQLPDFVLRFLFYFSSRLILMNRLMSLPLPVHIRPKMLSAMLLSLFSFTIRCNLSTLKLECMWIVLIHIGHGSSSDLSVVRMHNPTVAISILMHHSSVSSSYIISCFIGAKAGINQW